MLTLGAVFQHMTKNSKRLVMLGHHSTTQAFQLWAHRLYCILRSTECCTKNTHATMVSRTSMYIIGQTDDAPWTNQMALRRRQTKRKTDSHGDERTGSFLVADDTPERNIELTSSLLMRPADTRAHEDCTGLRRGCPVVEHPFFPVPELAFRQKWSVDSLLRSCQLDWQKTDHWDVGTTALKERCLFCFVPDSPLCHKHVMFPVS